MKHTLLPLAICALTLGACSKSQTLEHSNTPTIDVARVLTDSVTLSQSYPGSLAADKTVDVVARVNGVITSKNYETGKPVRAGQVLFTIEPTTYADAVQQAEAQLATAQSTYEYAKAHYEAVNRALAADAVSKMEVVQAKSSMEQAEASIKNARAALQTARQNLSYCTIRAPFDGMMGDNLYSVGSYVGGAAAPVTLAQIYATESMNVNFSIDDEQYLTLLKGLESAQGLDLDSVPLQFADTLPHAYFASLSFIAPALNQSTGTMQIQCKVKNPYNELKPGMFVTVKLPYGSNPHALLVKDSSIASDQLGQYLYTLNDSNRVIYTPIKTGDVVQDSLRIVTSGVDTDTRYVTRALLKVRDGMTVNPHLVK